MFLISGAALLRASFGTGAGRELEELVWVCYVDLGLGFHHWVLRLDALEETGKVLLR